MSTYTLNNGVKLPKIGLGTFRIEAGSSAYDTVLLALKAGYRHIDTAQMYGNESDIGRAIKDSGIPRHEIFVTSKLASHQDGDVSKIKASLDASLERLDIGYIDLMLIHWPNPNKEINQIVWQVFESYYKLGLFKAIGVSNFQIHHLEDLFKKAVIRPMANQIECHPLLTQIPLASYLESLDIQMIGYAPFALGQVFEGRTHETLLEIAKKYGATVAQVILAWLLKRRIAVIPKSVHEDRLNENLKALDLVLSEADLDKITGLNRGKRLYSDPDNNIHYR